ncbi:MAG: serine/threonine protein kinase, partial [Akkermansiaceae bacterium]|nr:serine/threonine protein kinase [Verrucomicrobiales bacterium]
SKCPYCDFNSNVAGGIAVVALAIILFFNGNLWFNWSVAALEQIPCALAWSLGWQWWQLKKEKDWLEAPLPDLWEDAPAVRSSVASAASASLNLDPIQEALPAIPDHELLRLVGRGAYGDVWLARDVLGSFHAVKIIRRAAFDHADPYDREFRGLQKFTPLSRAHPGLVHILHVGRNIAADCFYYVMEAGDDEQSGAVIEPSVYSARNLGRDLHRRAPLPPGECVELGTALCEALEFLHGQGLIHRDIKPANIIFVNGRPKLADIGLVTEMGLHRQQVSKVGTEGYLPPEGPGTAAGDLFALGKVLADMMQPRPAMGTAQSCADVPKPPDELAREKLRAIICTACADNPAERFASAGAMRDALSRVLLQL